MEKQIKIGCLCRMAEDVLDYNADYAKFGGCSEDKIAATVALHAYFLACRACRVDGQELLTVTKCLYRHNKKVIAAGGKPVHLKRRHTAYFLEV